jgi:PIN domain nuclease of toxin-antitoxin system
MGYLLDTHAFLWYLLHDPNLSQPVKDIIDTKTDLYFSVAVFHFRQVIEILSIEC